MTWIILGAAFIAATAITAAFIGFAPGIDSAVASSARPLGWAVVSEPNGWQFLFDPFQPGKYPDGFDRNREYEWWRGEGSEVQVFKLADVPEWFNVAGGLRYREICGISPVQREGEGLGCQGAGDD